MRTEIAKRFPNDKHKTIGEYEKLNPDIMKQIKSRFKLKVRLDQLNSLCFKSKEEANHYVPKDKTFKECMFNAKRSFIVDKYKQKKDKK